MKKQVVIVIFLFLAIFILSIGLKHSIYITDIQTVESTIFSTSTQSNPEVHYLVDSNIDKLEKPTSDDDIITESTDNKVYTKQSTSYQKCLSVTSDTIGTIGDDLFLYYGKDEKSGYIREPYPGIAENTENLCVEVRDSHGPTFHRLVGQYFADKDHVYYWNYSKGIDNPSIIEGANPDTFKEFSMQHQQLYNASSWTDLLFSDTDHIYYGGIVIPEINPDTVKMFTTQKILNSEYYIDNNQIYYFSPLDFGQIKNADSNSFEILTRRTLRSPGYSKDKFHVYKGTEIVEDANPNSFTPPKETPSCTEC